MTARIQDEQFGILEARLNALNDLFITSLNQELSNHSAVLETIRVHLKSLAEIKPGRGRKADRSSQIASFHLQNLEVLNKHFTSVSSESFLKRIIDEITNDIEQYLENSPEILSIPYPEGSSKVLRVHFRKLVQGYFFPSYLAQISMMAKESQQELMESYMALFEYEYAFIQNSYKIPPEGSSELEGEHASKQPAMPSGFFADQKKELEVLMQRSDMLDSMKFWRNMGGSIDYNKSLESLQKINKSWQSTFFAFFEDWRFREQLFAYIQSVHSAHLQVESIYSQRVKSSLLPEVQKQREYTSEMLGRLPDPDTSDMESVRSFFVSELYKLKKGKITEEQRANVLQAAEDIPKLLLKLENEVTERLDIFPEKVGVVNNPKYTGGVKPSEIFYFSPAEYIDYECVRDIQPGLDLLRGDLGNALQMIISEFDEYDQIVDFYLDSTISLTEKPGTGESEVITFFRDGLKRLLKITNRISELLTGLQNDKLAEISDLIRRFLDSVAELDDNSNIIHIYALLLKSKAIAESRSNRKKLKDFTGRVYTGGSTLVKNNTRWLQSSYSDLRRRLRLDSSAEPISSEISNYLTDIQHRIYKLPLIYQHLFENIPIRELNLFLSREDEINILNDAYADWLKDNFAASLVIGENGSGKSSLLYYYSKTLKSNHQILSFQISRFYFTEQDYYTLIGEIFGQDNLTGDQSINEFITSFKERRIVIIDGLERLFIRKVNGFACLQKLLSLIVSTNHQIFWICSVSKYASEYLNKTMALSEHFDYAIDIDSMNSKQIRDIVLKRNRLSGYQLNYQMGNAEDTGAKARKLNQNELEDKFFAELTQFAGSNISLSLNYWLQSIHSIQDDQVEIGDFNAPDFGFLENLSPEKAYTLLIVVMHGKISVEHHSLIFSQKTDRSYKVLTMLKEDSILVKQGEFYLLNGILFRHVVRVLKNRNLIH